jgi:hypothetical protein
MITKKQMGFISKVPIEYGDSCIFIPLLPSHSFGDTAELKIDSIANISPRLFFKPATLPIFGLYNSEETDMYNIRKDSNTTSIESYFGCEIPVFVKQIIFRMNGKKFFRCKKEDASKYFYSLYGVFEHEKFFWELALSTKCEKLDVNSNLREFWQGQMEAQKKYDTLKNALESYENQSKEIRRALGQLKSGLPDELTETRPDLLPFGDWEFFKAIYYDIVMSQYLENSFNEFYMFEKAMESISMKYNIQYPNQKENLNLKKKVYTTSSKLLLEKIRSQKCK